MQLKEASMRLALNTLMFHRFVVLRSELDTAISDIRTLREFQRALWRASDMNWYTSSGFPKSAANEQSSPYVLGEDLKEKCNPLPSPLSVSRPPYPAGVLPKAPLLKIFVSLVTGTVDLQAQLRCVNHR